VVESLGEFDRKAVVFDGIPQIVPKEIVTS
jgi:hypothetical protein